VAQLDSVGIGSPRGGSGFHPAVAMRRRPKRTSRFVERGLSSMSPITHP